MRSLPLCTAAVAAGACALLAACGDDGDGGPPPGPPATSLGISGTVATGAALAGASVAANCATGTGSATTDANGGFTLTIAGGALPCALEARGTPVGGSAVILHSVATAATANVTPLTELMVAQVTGADPAALMTGSASALATTFSAASVQAAQAKVLAVLVAAGVDGASSLASDDLFAGPLALGSAAGHDHVLDGLGGALDAGGSSLAALTGTLVAQAAATADPATVADAAAALAPELLLRPRAASCASLRSAGYWMLNSHAGGGSGDGGGGFAAHVVDAQAGTITQSSDGTLYTLTAVPGDPCHFAVVADDGSTGDAVVSPAGVIVARGSQSQLLLIGIPRQSHSPAELAGRWNWVGVDTFDTNNAAWVYDYGQIAVATDAGGTTLQLQKGCAQPSPGEVEACTTTPQELHALAAATDGGLVNTPASARWTDKMFAYQAGNGDWLAISSTCNIAGGSTCAAGIGDGSFGVASRTRTLAVPAAGTTTNSWNVYLDTATQLSTVGTDAWSTLVTSVDAATGAFTRTAGPTGGATHAETLSVNDPYDGFQFRDLATGVATSNGGSTTVRKAVFLKTGVGVSVIVQPVTPSSPAGRLVLSVGQPAP